MSRVSNFTLSGFLFGLLLFGAVTTLILTFSGDVFNTYGENVDSSALSKTAQKVNDDVTKDINQTREDAAAVSGSISANLFFIPSLANMVTTTIGAVSLVPTILTDLSTALPIPSPLHDLAYGFVIIGIGFAVWRLYTGGA